MKDKKPCFRLAELLSPAHTTDGQVLNIATPPCILSCA